ncbi:MAG: flagellar export protein FliJ [Thermodesulfobacteriota bacterium]
MPRFQFRLQKVLEYRRQREDQAKFAFAKAKADHDLQVNVVAALRTALDEHEASLYAGKRLTEGDIWLWRQYRRRLIQDMEQAEMRLMELTRLMNARRRELVERSKERKLLERLRTQQELEFRREANAREQREYDEMATIRFARHVY